MGMNRKAARRERSFPGELLSFLAACALWVVGGGSAQAFDHTHAAWDKVLKQRVKEGLVDYAALKANPDELGAYLESLAKVGKSEFLAWSEPQRLAFLFNLYNAATVKLIVDHYPVSSIKKIGGVFSSPWKQKRVPLFGTLRSLDDLEHDMLRVDYHEPRLHFAIVCAAKGCPALRSEAYMAERLNEQLEEQARAFMRNTSKNRIDQAKGLVYLSPIFDWFHKDFESKPGGVLAFVRPYFPSGEVLAKGEWSIKYTDYDWSLNEQSAPR